MTESTEIVQRAEFEIATLKRISHSTSVQLLQELKSLVASVQSLMPHLTDSFEALQPIKPLTVDLQIGQEASGAAHGAPDGDCTRETAIISPVARTPGAPQ